VDSHVDIRQESVMRAFAKSLLSAPGAFMRPTQAKRCDLLHIRNISAGVVHSEMTKSGCVRGEIACALPDGQITRKSCPARAQKIFRLTRRANQN
jgi:hypothetical protein